MSEDPVFRLWLRNFELAEKVTRLERLKDHWYGELIAERRKVRELQSRIDALKTEMQAKEDAFEKLVQARVDVLEQERVERVAAQVLGITAKSDDSQT